MALREELIASWAVITYNTRRMIFMQALRKTISNERGGAGLSAIIALAIVAACVYVGVQLIPIYWGHWNFEDNMKTLAQYAFVNITGDLKIAVEKEVKKGLDELGADYKNKDVKVKVDMARKKIVIDAAYTKTHKVPFLTNPLPFDIHVENTTLD